MRLRFLLLILSAQICGPRTGWAAPIQSAVFGGSITLEVPGPWHYWKDLAGYHWEYSEAGGTTFVTGLGNYTTNASSSAMFPCTPAGEEMDCSGASSYATKAIGQGSVTGGDAPTLTAMGQVENAAMWSRVSLAYYFKVEKLSPDAPDDVWLPISIWGSGLLFAGDSPSDSDLDYTYAYTYAVVQYQGPTDWIARSVFGDSVFNYSNPSNKTFTYSDTEFLQPGQTSQVILSVGGNAGGPPHIFGTGGLFQVLLDPQIRIAPGYLIPYHGQDVLATDLYDLTFSPELTSDLTEIPEPGSGVMTGMSLVAIATLLRRKPR